MKSHRYNPIKRNAPKEYKIEIKNLHWNVGVDEVQDLFGNQIDYPGFITCNIYYDKAGRSTGNAIVSYDNENSANDAISFFHNREFDGMPMSVSLYDVPSRPSIMSRLGSKHIPISERLGAKPHSNSSRPVIKTSTVDQRKEPKRGINTSIEVLNNEIDKYMAGMEETPTVESRKIISYEEIHFE